ncbi:MAG: heparinase II/III family protein [Sphingorhabdus sp.]|uniref:heparinase II/III family protein n=1 Tax=Sphingorhabdus sp. TaxID=1902408 RepID=UPI0038FCE9F0
MTDHEARGEGIRQAALIVRPTGVGQNIFERLSLQFYKLTWRTPLHSGRLRGKVPLRLITIPQDVLKGDVARGQALRMGKFHYQGAEQSFTGVDYQKLALPPAMTDYIHRFGWLRDLAAATNRGEGAPIAAAIADEWLIANGMKIREPAWRVDNCAWRLLNMAAGSPLLLSSADPVYRSRVINHFARVARHLDQSAPRAQSHFAKSLGWAGVVAASLLLPEGKARRAVGEDGLAAALQVAIFPDGGVVSRSPVQLIELIGLLSLLKQCYNARNEMVPAFLSDAIGRAVPALLGLTHSDGGLGAWQGSANMTAQSVEALVQASEVRARPHRQALDWGYQRVSAGKSVLLLDAGPPPLARQSASGCASTLAFELSHGSQRLIVNCGGAALVGATIPVALARGLRTTAAHSTLCINDTNSTAILQGGQLGKGVAEVGLERRDVDQATRIEASHDGYVRGFGYVHSRLLILRSDGQELRGEDTLLPKGKPKDGTPVHVRFHLGPDIEIMPTDNGQTALLRMADGSNWAFAAAGGALSIDESLWVDEDGRPHPSRQLIIEAPTGKGGLTFSWQLRHLG